jgi:hypothetical protein
MIEAIDMVGKAANDLIELSADPLQLHDAGHLRRAFGYSFPSHCRPSLGPYDCGMNSWPERAAARCRRLSFCLKVFSLRSVVTPAMGVFLCDLVIAGAGCWAAVVSVLQDGNRSGEHPGGLWRFMERIRGADKTPKFA